MKTQPRRKPIVANRLLLALIMSASPMLSRAADVFLKSSDSINTSSLTNASNWTDGQVPSPANDYYTGPYFLRTPPDSGGVTTVFQGHSLTLSLPAVNGARNIIFKGGANDVIVINNLTNAYGGILENGGSGNQLVTYTGNLFTIAANSAIVANQGPLICGYPLSGADGVILTNAGGNVITYTNNNSAFTGKFYLSTVNFGNGGGNTTVALGALNSVPGNPSTFTPDQILLEGGTTLRDDAGITFNNANSGITLAGNATLNTTATTTMNEPITDNGGGFTLTKAGAGTLVLNGANSYSGGTVISAGTLQIGAAGTLPVGSVTVNGSLDLNGFNLTVDGLSGSGSVDTLAAGTVTLTVGTNGGGGTFTGFIQNSVGTLNLTKVGAGSLTLSGGFSHSGRTVVAGGTLNLLTSGLLPPVPGDLIVSNGAIASIDATLGVPLPASNVTVGTGSTLGLAIYSGTTALNASGTLTFQPSATNTFDFGTLTANPAAPAITAGAVAATGANIVIKLNAIGLQTGTFPLIQFSGTAPSLANFVLDAPPGVVATLQITGSTIEVNVSSSPKNLTWYGGNSATWDLNTVNWRDPSFADVVYQQYTNGLTIAGDAARFDDTLFNDGVNPQPTNITLNATVYPFPLTFDSTLPYRISGSGGIAGTSSLVKSNSGSLTLNTVNTYSGGTYVYGGSLVVNSDAALGAAGKSVTLRGGTLEFSSSTTSARPISVTTASSIGVASGATAQLDGNITSSATLNKVSGGTLALTGSNTVNGVLSVNAGTLNVPSGTLRFTGNPSYVAYLTGTATLNLSSGATLSSAGELRVGGSDQNGTGFDANGIFNMTGGNAYLSALTVARGNNNQNSCAGEVNISGGTMISTNDVLVGFAGTGKGTLRISGNGTLQIGTTATKWLRFGQWDSTSGEIDVSGGNLNLNQGTSIKFNQNNSSGPKTFNQDGGAVTFYSDYATTIGGAGDLDLMLTGTAAATNTYNLNGGTLTVPRVRSSGNTGTRIFNFNGGTLKPTASSTIFFNLGTGSATANVRNGGAIIDDRGFSITIAQSLLHSTVAGDNVTDGGLTKKGNGSVTLSGANTYNGKTTVAAGSLLMTTASLLSGDLAISNNATLSIAQVGSATKTTGNLSFYGAAKPGATLGLALTAANDPAVPMINCGTLTLTGTNTISLAGAIKLGNIALIKATGAVAGSGSITNLILPQGAQGTIAVNFDGTFTTISAVITSTGPGLTWTGGTNNLWDINTSTNWLLSGTSTKYQQTIVPGDAVTFDDNGSGTVTLNTTVGPAGLVISNNSKAYTFGGSGNVTGPATLVKQGSGTALLNLTNNSYSGNTIISNGTLQLGSGSAISAGNLNVSAGGTLELAGISTTIGELTGSGIIDNNSGLNPVLTVGTAAGGIWNGNIQDQGAGGVILHKVGSGTLVLGGNNYLNNGQPFGDLELITGGTVILTNGGLLSVAELQLQIANGANQTAAVVVDGGTLAVTNNVLSVGYGATTATGTLTVNSGTVFHGGPGGGAFAAVPNSIDVGAQGATGTLIVNGGQVLNTSALYLGDGTDANGTLRLNGGLLQATSVGPNGTPASSTAYFNGGTLLAASNSVDFIRSTALVQSGGLVFDDGGYSVSLVSMALTEDPGSVGGGLIKKGSGALYLNNGADTYTGTTVVSNGLLAGTAFLYSPVVVESGGRIGAGGDAAIGTLQLNSQPLTIHGQAFLRISKDSGFVQNDAITGISTANYGGTLVITNATADGTPLAAGDSFTLFTAATHNGNFSSISGSPGPGLSYSFANGVLTIGSGPSTTPPTITTKVSGNSLQLAWPADHLGWTLQTNSVGLTVTNQWFPYPGSTSVTNVSIPLNTSLTNVFFRMVYP